MFKDDKNNLETLIKIRDLFTLNFMESSLCEHDFEEIQLFQILKRNVEQIKKMYYNYYDEDSAINLHFLSSCIFYAQDMIKYNVSSEEFFKELESVLKWEKENILIEFQDCCVANIDAIVISKFGQEILMCPSVQEFNRIILSKNLSYFVPVTYNHSAHILLKPEGLMDKEIPPFFWTVVLVSDVKINDEDDGSVLAITWFDEMSSVIDLRKCVEEKTKNICWLKKAEGYCI